MILMPDTVVGVLATGAHIRLQVVGLMPDTMVRFAAVAKQSGGFVEFVIGAGVLMPDTMRQIGAAGGNHVGFDFVSKV